MLAAGAAPARAQPHARILLKADQSPGGADAAIAAALDVGERTVARVRARWVAGGWAGAVPRRGPRRASARRLDGAGEARLIALACGAPPAGRERWTLRPLAQGLVEARVGEGIAPHPVRATLKKASASPG